MYANAASGVTWRWMSWCLLGKAAMVKLLPATKTVVDPPAEGAAGSGMSECCGCSW